MIFRLMRESVWTVRGLVIPFLGFLLLAGWGVPVSVQGAADPFDIYQEGIRLDDAKDRAGAISAFKRVIAVAKGSYLELQAHYQLGIIYLSEGQYQDAVQEFDEGLRLLKLDIIKRQATENDFKIPLLGKARAYERSGELQKALEMFESLARPGVDRRDDIARLKGLIAKRQGAIQTAQLSINKAIEIEKQGHHREALKHYLAALAIGNVVDPHNLEKTIVEKVIVLVRTLDPPPAIPEEARRQAVYAHTALKEAKDASGFNQAIGEYFKAIRLAPWWGDLYLNTALLLEQTGHFSVAVTSLQFFLLASPNDPDTEKVKNKIYELEYKAKAEKR